MAEAGERMGIGRVSLDSETCSQKPLDGVSFSGGRVTGETETWASSGSGTQWSGTERGYWAQESWSRDGTGPQWWWW